MLQQLQQLHQLQHRSRGRRVAAAVLRHGSQEAAAKVGLAVLLIYGFL